MLRQKSNQVGVEAAVETRIPCLRMPAEWELHASTWLAWPRKQYEWLDDFKPVLHAFAKFVTHLSGHERIDLLVADAVAEEEARKLLSLNGATLRHVRFHHRPTDRVWLRDSGCTFIQVDGALRAVKWRFNAWAKYPQWELDEQVGGFMARHAHAEEIHPKASGRRIVMEGGAIDVNGRGVLLTTEECLLSPVQQRNAGLDREGYERVFRKYLGIRQVIWLYGGLEGDDTHGHVDDLCRFVAPDTVLAVVEKDPADPNFAPCRENLERLRAARDPAGKPFRVLELPLPAPRFDHGRRLPANYANFYIANGAVLVPQFRDPQDPVALGILRTCFPDRLVIGVHCGEFIRECGALHCLAQQQPMV